MLAIFFVVKGSAADVTDAPQTECLLCNPVMKMKKNMSFFSFFSVMEHGLNEIDRVKPKDSGKKTSPSATLSTTNPTWTDPGFFSALFFL